MMPWKLKILTASIEMPIPAEAVIEGGRQEETPGINCKPQF
jgi:hypothetical protein